MERSEVEIAAAALDIGLCMALLSFARLDLSDAAIEEFFKTCSERLITQGLSESSSKQAISQMKHAHHLVCKGLYICQK